ncbi:MAG: CcmD family protein [Bryobacteraceae bacterium]
MEGRNLTYMFYGLLAAWLILAVYVAALAGRGRRLERELANLRRMLEDRQKEAS